MIKTMDCGEARISLGVYVLGSIDPAERSMVDAHLATCRDCRDELAGLAGLPALLARVSTEEAIALAEDAPPASHPRDGQDDGAEDDGGQPDATEAGPRSLDDGPPPKELLGTVLDLTAARRRRRQWRAAGLSAAAAVIIAAAAFGGARVAAGHGTSSPPTASGLDYGNAVTGWTTVQGSANGMYGTIMYRQMGWGTQVAAKVVGVPVDTYCTLVAVAADGTRTAIGGWTTDTAEGTIWYPASSGIPAGQVREFQITVTGHKTISIPV
jgi:predicted anti-sigma-YlaC factor YlaD